MTASTTVSNLARPAKSASAQLTDLALCYLEQIGVEYVFGIPGGAIEPLYNALARSARRGGIQPIVARHEAGSAFMADGYTRESGKLGVCAATTGPGATNLLTGVACAYENEIPMLVITGQSALPRFGRAAFQESSCTGIDVVDMFKTCTRYSTLVSHPDQFEHKFVTAVMNAFGPRPGPVHLSVPLDVARAPWPGARPKYQLPELLRRSSSIDSVALDRLERELSVARRPVLLIGAGCGEAIAAIMEFAAARGLPFVTTPQAKGYVHAAHPLNKGVFGFAGHLSAAAALREDAADLILALGTTFGEWTSAAWSDVLMNQRMIHIDAVEEHFTQSPMARLHVRGSIAAIFEQLLARSKQREQHDASIAPARASSIVALPTVRWDAQTQRFNPSACEPNYAVLEAHKMHSDEVPIKPQRLMHELSQLFPPQTRFLADTGNATAWSVHYLAPLDRRAGERRSVAGAPERATGRRTGTCSRLRTLMEFAPMGWGIGGAVGVALARRGVPVVCITGDGSFLMNGQEITVAVAEKLPVIFLILNDAALGMVKHGQRLTGAERVAFALPRVDFAAMACAMGAQGISVRTPQDLLDLDIGAICARPGPTLLDVHIDAEEVPPMQMRAKVLEAAR
jgi:acetolactate synthase I/II/III large subunit